MFDSFDKGFRQPPYRALSQQAPDVNPFENTPDNYPFDETAGGHEWKHWGGSSPMEALKEYNALDTGTLPMYREFCSWRARQQGVSGDFCMRALCDLLGAASQVPQTSPSNWVTTHLVDLSMSTNPTRTSFRTSARTVFPCLPRAPCCCGPLVVLLVQQNESSPTTDEQPWCVLSRRDIPLGRNR